MLMRYKDSPDPPPPDKVPPGAGDKIMHAAFRLGEATVMASDVMCTCKAASHGFALSLDARDESDAQRLFAALADGGQVRTGNTRDLGQPEPGPRLYHRDHLSDEFTCLCPRAGYPDFATIHITYVPNRKIVELKALKLWLNSFRGQSISHAAVTNLIFDVLKKNLRPRKLEVTADFNVRGNVKTVIRVTL